MLLHHKRISYNCYNFLTSKLIKSWCKTESRCTDYTIYFLLHSLFLQHLYKIERLCDEANLPADERKAKRNELSRPIMEAMKLWMETEGIMYSESSQIGKAITYAYTLWDNMMHYLDDRTGGCLGRQRKKSRKPRPERTFRDDPFRQENLYYNKEEDCYVCPMGQHMALVGVTRKVSDNGFASYSYKYRAQSAEPISAHIGQPAYL